MNLPGEKWAKQTCKPSSVPQQSQGGDHPSSPDVTIGVKRPTRGRARHPSPSYSVLLRVGFTQPTSHLAAGELLPHHFTLTLNAKSGMFLWHFP